MPERPWRLAALVPLPAEAVQGLIGDLPFEVVVPARRDQVAVREVLADADVALGDWTSALLLGEQEAAAAARLAYVHQPSVGVEHIDLDAFAARGVPVSNGADVNAVSVAEWCVGAALTVLRSMPWLDREVRAGGWPAQVDVVARAPRELAALRVGLVGFGRIGVVCAERFAAFGCPVSYWTRTRRRPEQEHGATYRDLDELLATSDVLVVAIALGPATRGLLGADRLARLPRGAVLVNAGRGGIVDEDALRAALASGALAGAALDVFAAEPLPADSPWRSTDRVLLSPHLAGATVESVQRLVARTQENLRRVLAGEPVTGVLNGVDPLVRRRA